MEFKKLLKEIRLKKGIKARELAKKAGVTDVYIYAIENPNDMRLPSDNMIRRIAHALAENEVEEAQISKQLLSAKALSKIAEEARNSIEKEKIEKIIPTESMPIEFVEKLKKDLENKNIDEISQNSGINKEIINNILQYRGIISRKDVVALAMALNQSVYDYLLAANYVPDNVKNLLKYDKISSLLRSLEDLSSEDINSLVDGIISIIEAYKRKTHDRGKHKSSRKRFPKEK
ncbi:MAG: helix-turn-helix transcriptional regulator [Candidatus Micrarchaeia archaeon]